ncbi:hypothetical protein Btru_015259 [Bulinus truncatus]|nr:hypothetical protein Btru_015259 [Bulinus truncatus]
MNSKTGLESHDSSTKQLLANGVASSSSPNIAHQYSNVQARQKSNVRAASAKYFDVAATILGGSRDVEEVFLNTAKNGDLKKLEQLLNQSGSIGLDIDCKDKRTGNTALIWASKRGHVKIVETLLKYGAEVTLCNHEAQTALETAHSSVRTILLDWVEAQTQLNERLLLQASWQGNLSVVRKILMSNKRSINVNCQSAEGLTPLMLVTRDVQLFERLSVQLNRHYSPVQVAEELIKARADIHASDADGRSCLHYISMSKAGCADKLVTVLISGGMDVEVHDKNLFTPIHLASQLGNTSNVVALADGGSDVNVKGFAGTTPLHLTAYNDHQKTASKLISYGADVTLQDDRGFTALDLAKTKKMKTLLKDAWTDAATNGHHKSRSDIEKSESYLNNKNGDNGKNKNEVIFDDLVNRSTSSPILKPVSAKTRVLSNVEKCKQAEKKILQEVEALKAAHPVLSRETTRILGTTRSKILPQIGRSTSPIRTKGAASPDQNQDPVNLNLEETRHQLLSRGRSVSDIKLGYRQSGVTSSFSSDDFISQFNLSRASPSRHRKSDSDPYIPSVKSIADSCDLILSGPQASVKNKSSCSSPMTQKSFFFTDKKSSPDDDVFTALDPSFDYLRSRSILKEEFILEESRPKDLISISDASSSISSFSTPSPRDMPSVQQSPLKSYKRDPVLETLVEQRASLQFSSSPLELLNSPEAVLIRPQIRNPRQKVRHRSDTSLSSSLDSETEADRKSKRLLSRTSNILRKSYGSETSSSSDSVSVHKSQSLESLSPRLQTQITSQRGQMKPVSLSDESINMSSKNSAASASNPKDILKLDLSHCGSVSLELKHFPKQTGAVKPFSGKARLLISADLENWDSKSKKLYFGNKKEKRNPFSTPGISPSNHLTERNKASYPDSSRNILKETESSSTSEVNNQKQPFAISESVPDFSNIVKINLTTQEELVQEDGKYFVVSKESEVLASHCKKKLEEKVIGAYSKEKVSKPSAISSTKMKSSDKAAMIERSIIKNQKSGISITHGNLTEACNDRSALNSDFKKQETPIKPNLTTTSSANFNQSQQSVIKAKTKVQSPVKSTPNQSQNSIKRNNISKTPSPQAPKSASKDKLAVVNADQSSRENAVSQSKIVHEPKTVNQPDASAGIHKPHCQTSLSKAPHAELYPSHVPITPKKTEVPITTPLIVDPFEEFPQTHIKVIENSTTDAVVKIKKPSCNKNHKKSSSSKRPVSGSSRQSSAGKKRTIKGKELKTNSELRPKSNRKNGRQKNTKADEESDEMYSMTESENVVLVSGIGWQLSTSCNKPSHGNLSHNDFQNDVGQSPNGQQLTPENKAFLKAFREKITENSPRFLEMKKQLSDTSRHLAIVDDDGYCPMNLDITQKHVDDILKEGLHQEMVNEDDIISGKLTPITEMSVSQTCDISSALRGSGAEKLQTCGHNNIHKSSHSLKGVDVMTQAAKMSQSGNGLNSKFHVEKDICGDHVKTNAPDDDNLDEVIEEILSLTTSSLSSTLKGSSSRSKPQKFSGSHTLTYGDRKLLGQMSNLNWNSPFHAQRLSSTLDVAVDQKLTSNICSSEGRDDLMKSSQISKHAENLDDIVGQVEEEQPTLNAKELNVLHSVHMVPVLSKPPPSNQTTIRDDVINNVIPVRRSSSTKFCRRREQVSGQSIVDEEAKQLAKVINSFKQMELTATSGRQDSGCRSSKSPIRLASGQLAVGDPNFSSRPSSTNTSFKMKGKFRELKENSVRSTGLAPDIRINDESNKTVIEDKKNSQDVAVKLLKLSGVEVNNITQTAEKVNTDGAREKSLTDSTSDSVKDVDDTIQWKKGNILGRGAFGTVWCGLTNEGQLIAVKQIELTTIDKSKAQHEYEKVQEEVELLKTLEHPNIVGYLGTSLEDNIVSIFMQFIPGGSLASVLARFGALEESVFRRYTKQILEGVKYLHDNDVIHRDLKGANVMLMPNGVIKLIDFGCAKRLCINLSISQVEILKSMKGTPFWMAPEVVNETGHGKKSDIWSIGCTVFEMATRNPPWSDMNPMAAIFAIGSATRPVPVLDEKFSEDARNFVSQCLTRDQNVRPDAPSLLQHPFIAQKFKS